MTPLLIAILRRDLEQLVSSKLSQVSQSSPETVELSLYHPERSLRVIVATLLPQRPLIFWTSEKKPALANPPNFCRSLRKHLEFAQLVSVESTPGERILSLGFKTPGGLFRLVFEGIPKYPNLILVGPDGKILSALRYKNEVERPVIPQEPYFPPPRDEKKIDFWGQDPKALESLWKKAAQPPLGSWAKDQFHGVDSELASHLEKFGESAFAQWETLKKKIIREEWGGLTLFPGPPPSLRVFPTEIELTKDHKVFPSARQALAAFFESESLYRNKLSEKSRLESEINRALKHEKRIQGKLKNDRQEAERSDQYQWWGEILMAQLHKVKLHQSSVVLEDVVRGRPDPVSIPLDPELTPLRNAQRFFKKAQKGSRGLAQVEKREKEVEERIQQLKSAQRSLPALETPEETRKAFEELFPRKKPVSPRPKKAKEEKVPTPNISRLKLDKKFEIYAGTSAVANDYVTFQLAQPEDLWFHVRDLPGAHVVLRCLQRDAKPSEEFILAAAQWAADHSKAKPGEKVTVSYTEKKNVRKIPGAPAGMVTLTKEKSLTLKTGEKGSSPSPELKK